MEKLIELLNKFERETFPEEHEYVRFPDWTDDDWWYWYYVEQPNLWEQEWFNYSSNDSRRDNELNHLLIISKEFWFIKWLVENDKIDRKEFEKNLDDNEVIIEWDMNTRDLGIIAYKELLMLLAIQDEPIRFLCEIIK